MPGKTLFSPFLKQCFVTTTVCIHVIGHGCILGYPSVLLPQLRQPNSVIPLTEDEASWIASVMAIGMLVGIFLTPPIMGRLGRKIAHYVVILTLLAAWFIFTLATSFVELIIARILQGLSYGMFTPLRSVLIGEYTSPKNRGAFLTTISLAQGIGLLLVHLTGSSLSWQRTALLCLSFPFVSLIMTVYSPESPSWLADKGKYEECREVFHWLRGYEENKELEDMIEARLVAKQPNNIGERNVLRIVKKKEFFKPVLVMVHTYCMMSFSGSMSIAAYATKILGSLMGPDADANFWMVVLDIQRLISNSAAVYVVNKTKRRIMMFSTLGLCIFSHLAIAAYVYAEVNGLIPNVLWLAVILINLQVFTIATGMVPLPGVIAGEIFPLAYRSIGGSISIAFYSGSLFTTLKTFPGLVDSIGLHGTYVVYAGILTYTFVILWYFLPETKGKTLQQIEDEFKGTVLITEGEIRQSLQFGL